MLTPAAAAARDRQQAGMGVGAVAEILEHVLFAGERRLPDPGDALRAHMRDGRACGGSAPTAPCRDSRCRPWRGCPRAPWSSVVRAARTEIRRALQSLRRQCLPAGRSNASSFARRCSSAGLRWPSLRRRRDDGGRDHGRRQLAFARQQRRAALVALADHRGPPRGIDVVENAQQLVLDKTALLLDDEHVLQAFGELPRAGSSSGQVSATL